MNNLRNWLHFTIERVLALGRDPAPVECMSTLRLGLDLPCTIEGLGQRSLPRRGVLVLFWPWDVCYSRVCRLGRYYCCSELLLCWELKAVVRSCFEAAVFGGSILPLFSTLMRFLAVRVSA